MLHSSELVRPFQVVNSHWETGSGNSEKTTHRATPLNSEEPISQSSIAALQLVTYQAGQPHSVVAKTVSKMEGLLAVSGASLLYAGYPFDPFA